MTDTNTKTIEEGQLVTDDRGGEYIYGGPLDRIGGGYTITFDFRNGGLSKINGDPHSLIPTADLPGLDLKDQLIDVANDKAGRPGSWMGPWRAQVPGDVVPHWHKTKREAVQSAALRIAIRNWWGTTETKKEGQA